MRLTIYYTTQLKAALGMGSEQVDTRQLDLPPGFSAAQLLSALADRHGDQFRQMALGADGAPSPSLLVCVGDEQIATAEPLQLREGDTITLLSAISGG